MRPRKFAKIKDVFINFSVKKGPHITKFKDARANGGPKIKLKGALSKKKKKNGTTQAARTGVWPEQQQKTARVWTKTIAV